MVQDKLCKFNILDLGVCSNARMNILAIILRTDIQRTSLSCLIYSDSLTESRKVMCS